MDQFLNQHHMHRVAMSEGKGDEPRWGYTGNTWQASSGTQSDPPCLQNIINFYYGRQESITCACIHVALAIICVQIQSDLEKVTSNLPKPQMIHLPIYFYSHYSPNRVVVRIRKNIVHHCSAQNLAHGKCLMNISNVSKARHLELLFSKIMLKYSVI